MYFTVNDKELDALCGLSYIQQITYLRGIRPYMDRNTFIVGIKRRISYQSLAEVLYIEPHQGITESGSPSRQQIRRAVKGLERSGLILIQSFDKHLILKCLLADISYCVQNKPGTNPTQQADTKPHAKLPINTGYSESVGAKADTDEILKADTPLIKENNYIYLLQHFDHFWRMYPEKKSRERAFEMFKQINPDELLLQSMLQALAQQIKAHTEKEAHGEWVPAWKFPANWLSQKCWEDEVKVELTQEKRNEKCGTNTKSGAIDPFWNPETGDAAITDEDGYKQSNVINLQCYRQ
ncbi:hypothetical protein SC613_01155 [Legionella pneumophila]|uniref:hypothetical protein n=1 Tax=Legionella pneumophila TaxID=446 RepID=UPI001A3269E6|nr:hypothetical protein [Legionella pneumophila]HAT8863263.1 hypothetical protein [Legionella pneumophila subsp. pneumophila]MCZ4689289.1 hypothetical protein [Legionella pneumophila]MDW9185286.1 hypothetical protein [Legionella pneumophila]HAT2053612.1 hypothetical protein [Legionella pneumophila]HAT8892795.1 hypothetical protein [Legionella pneumophila subsp. pneumophila]